VHGLDVIAEHVDEQGGPVEPGDTHETLAARVQARELTLYPETLKRIFAGEIDLDRL